MLAIDAYKAHRGWHIDLKAPVLKPHATKLNSLKLAIELHSMVYTEGVASLIDSAAQACSRFKDALACKALVEAQHANSFR